MRTLALLILAALPANAATPIRMTFTGQVDYHTPAYGYTTCYYTSALNDLSLRIVVADSSCPYYIKYDPAAGTWTR